MRASDDAIEIRPATAPPVATVSLPGSKSLTNRALVLGALADGETTLERALESDDTEWMAQALRALGFETLWDRSARRIRIVGQGGRLPVAEADLYGGNAGTVVRFLTPVLALGRGRFRIDGDARMRERPIGDLLDALGQLGVRAWSDRGNGCPPVTVEAEGIAGGEAVIPGETSSQFTSALLLVSPYARQDVTLRTTGHRVGVPFVDMTVRMMERAGVRVERLPEGFHVPSAQQYRSGAAEIEPDATAASYFLAAAALLGGRITVPGLRRDALQGDVAFVDVLQAMGAGVEWTDEGVTVSGGPSLLGVDRDVRDYSDTFLTLAALAPFAEGPTTLRGIGHTRHQETDRVAAVARELRRLGVRVEEMPESLVIHPGTPASGEVETYEDHRMAMAFALIGLRVPGIRIRNPGCVRKTFPGYFRELERILTT